MSVHIALPWLEPLEPGLRRVRPAAVSKQILTDLLRQRMGFEDARSLRVISELTAAGHDDTAEAA